MTEIVSVPLSPDIVRRLRDYVDAGVGADESEVVSQALSLLDAEDDRRLQAIREKVRRSLEDPRPSIPADIAFERVLSNIK